MGKPYAICEYAYVWEIVIPCSPEDTRQDDGKYAVVARLVCEELDKDKALIHRGTIREVTIVPPSDFPPNIETILKGFAKAVPEIMDEIHKYKEDASGYALSSDK